jgi:hypothetical protein
VGTERVRELSQLIKEMLATHPEHHSPEDRAAEHRLVVTMEGEMDKMSAQANEFKSARAKKRAKNRQAKVDKLAAAKHGAPHGGPHHIVAKVAPKMYAQPLRKKATRTT